jgi:hypothetical protein
VRITVWATRERIMRDRMPTRRLRVWMMVVTMGTMLENGRRRFLLDRLPSCC